MRPAKLSISNKGVLNCAGKYKVQHLCGYYKFYYNLFENKVRFWQAKLKFQFKLPLFLNNQWNTKKDMV